MREDAVRFDQEAPPVPSEAHSDSGRADPAIGACNQSFESDPRQSLDNWVIVNLQGRKDIAASRAALDRLKNVDPANSSIANLDHMIEGPSNVPPSQPSANMRQRIF